jgi:hypothetical protein
MKITEDVRKYAAEHGLIDAEAVESGMEGKEERIPGERRRTLREWVARPARVLVSASRRNEVLCFWIVKARQDSRDERIFRDPIS